MKVLLGSEESRRAVDILLCTRYGKGNADPGWDPDGLVSREGEGEADIAPAIAHGLSIELHVAKRSKMDGSLSLSAGNAGEI